MQTTPLHHINLSTANVEGLVRFYGNVFGFHPGPRPPFGNHGAWLYAGNVPLIHLVEVSRKCKNLDPQISHFAFTGKELSKYMETLRELDVPYHVSVVPELELRQVFAHDPDGNLFEVLFAQTEQADLNDYKW